MRNLSGRSVVLLAVAIVLAAALAWTHHSSLTSNGTQTTSRPQAVLYGQHAQAHVLGVVLTAPLCAQQQIPARQCAQLPETVTFTDPVTNRTVGTARVRGGRFTISFPIVLGRNYHCRATTVWQGHRFQSQQNDFLLGRPAALSRILLSY